MPKPQSERLPPKRLQLEFEETVLSSESALFRPKSANGLKMPDFIGGLLSVLLKSDASGFP
jgi:hypothetical protein